MELELQVQPEHMSAFIHQAELVLQSRRVKTGFGREQSTHWIHAAIQAGTGIWPIIVVLQVRIRTTKGGRKEVQLFLADVRPPDQEEITEGGYAELPDWPDGLADAARRLVLKSMEEAATGISKPPDLTKFSRGYLAFFGTRLAGHYQGGGWWLSVPVFPGDVSAGYFCEQMIACAREMTGSSDYGISLGFMDELSKLAVLLTVFWCTHVQTAHGAEQRWVFGELVDGNFETELRQLGFTEPVAVQPREMPSQPILTGPTRNVDRLNPDDYASPSEGFRPPDDADMLLDLFYDISKHDPVTSERFLAAAKAYQTAHHIWQATATGALAYLVVAAESLVEADLPVCSGCGSKTGVFRAMRDLVFDELPGARTREEQVNKLLKEVYRIRSKHFHAGEFAAGELEPWQPVGILQPTTVAMRETYSRMNALVNALLVSWLIKRGTDKVWPRAVEAFPEWKEHQMFSVLIQMGGAAEDSD